MIEGDPDEKEEKQQETRDMKDQRRPIMKQQSNMVRKEFMERVNNLPREAYISYYEAGYQFCVPCRLDGLLPFEQVPFSRLQFLSESLIVLLACVKHIVERDL